MKRVARHARLHNAAEPLWPPPPSRTCPAFRPGSCFRRSHRTCGTGGHDVRRGLGSEKALWR